MSVKIIVLTSQRYYCAKLVLESTELFSHLQYYEGQHQKSTLLLRMRPYSPLVLQTAKLVYIDGISRLNTIVRTEYSRPQNSISRIVIMYTFHK